MKRKLRNSIWLILLLALSFPVGFAYQFAHNNMATCNELEITLITSGIAMIILFGLISLVVRLILRKRNHPDPTKVALIVYSVLVFIFLLMAAYGFEDAVLKKCGGQLW